MRKKRSQRYGGREGQGGRSVRHKHRGPNTTDLSGASGGKAPELPLALRYPAPATPDSHSHSTGKKMYMGCSAMWVWGGGIELRKVSVTGFPVHGLTCCRLHC